MQECKNSKYSIQRVVCLKKVLLVLNTDLQLFTFFHMVSYYCLLKVETTMMILVDYTLIKDNVSDIKEY
jgi:hypothetical protein